MSVRDTLHQFMVATLKDEKEHGTWTYRAIRPMPVPRGWSPGLRITGDCSKGVQYLCRWANAPDPMGNNWSDYGNSATICMHLSHLDRPSQLEVGDIVTFGAGGSSHAAMVIERGSDPLLWSFGHQGAPNTYRLSQDRRTHQLLRLPVAVEPPTPAERLRARTGYFSWVAWKLGEGDWKKWGKANPKVRPNVPKVIPPLWWKRYAQFLLNRKKGDSPTTTASRP